MIAFATRIRTSACLIGALALFQLLRLLRSIDTKIARATVSIQRKHDLFLNPKSVDMSLIRPYMPDEDRRKVTDAIQSVLSSKRLTSDS